MSSGLDENQLSGPERIAERQLLYYDHYQIMPKHWNGSPIYHVSCKDVKTGEDITLGFCFYSEQVSDALGRHYYEEVTDAAEDFDILWDESDKKISPVSATFKEVQADYQRMLREGVSPENINSVMMERYRVKPRTRR